VTQTITHSRAATPSATFRAQQLLPRLQAIHDRITGVAARFVHLVLSTAAWTMAQGQLAALLDYGEPVRRPHEGDWSW
jgi:phosphoribosylformylglycinamidine synthase